MKYTTFEKLLLNCVDLYNTGIEKDKSIEKALGGDTTVIQSWYGDFIDTTLNVIESEFNDKNETIQWLFWECLVNDKVNEFEVDNVRYIGNIKNIYLELNNMLDELTGETVPKVETKSEIKRSPIDDIIDYINEANFREIRSVLSQSISTSTNLKNISSRTSSILEEFKRNNTVYCYDVVLNDNDITGTWASNIDVPKKFKITIKEDKAFIEFY